MRNTLSNQAMENINKINTPIKIIFLALIAAVLAIVTFFVLTNKDALLNKLRNQKPGAGPTPPLVTSKERLDILGIVPIKKEGEYTFEYLPNSQTFFLRIENNKKEKEIRQEVANLIKPATEDGNYCKLGVLVWAYKSKNTVLPGC